MKSLFILSFILSCSASNFLIYDLPADHFDVAYGTDRPSSEFGHFHAYVEVRTERTQRDDEFWVKTRRGQLRPGQIRQNFIQPHGTYYFDENENGKFVLLFYCTNRTKIQMVQRNELHDFSKSSQTQTKRISPFANHVGKLIH